MKKAKALSDQDSAFTIERILNAQENKSFTNTKDIFIIASET